MDTKNLLDGQNLPEKGAENVENKSTNQEQENVTNNSSEVQVEQEVMENTQHITEEAEEKSNKAEMVTDENAAVQEALDFNDVDYSALNKKELLSQMNEIVRHYDVELIKDAVEDIRNNFYKKHKVEKQEAQAKFEAEGGNLEEFNFVDSVEDTFKEIYNLFKRKKYEANVLLEEEKKGNLKIKYQIIDEIKELINNEESINKTFQDFKELQQRWYNVGLVPQKDLKNLWETYHHAVESFYDFIKINKELRDLDLKKNLEEKTKICKLAEELLLIEPVTKAFKELQEFHDLWREIGPVPREEREPIWERFKAATTAINKKHQQFFDDLKIQQNKNLEEKTKLCEQVEAILEEKIEKAKEWEEQSAKVIEIQKLWKETGFARKKDNNKIYNRFKIACDKFFAGKRDFYKETKDFQKNNLQTKIELCEQAEAHKDSTDWKETTEFYIKLQKEWKTIGPVPKKASENIWNRFRGACDAFFDAKKEFYQEGNEQQEDNLKLKQALIEKINAFESTRNKQEDLDKLVSLQKEWTEIGYVPFDKKNEINKEFYASMDNQFEKLKIEQKDRNLLNFQNKVDNWAESQSKGKIYSERNKLSTQIRELENEIALYENNIGFFSQSSINSSMLNGVNKKIEKAKERIEVLKSKLSMLDNIEL